MSDTAKKIEEIDETLQSGVRSTSADGHSVTLDLDRLAKQRRELALDDPDQVAKGRIKPVTTRMRTSGAW